MDGHVRSEKKFCDPAFTATGEARAKVSYSGTKTLWFNTGTLCNIECINCYIESSPKNDRLVYLRLSDVTPYLDELEQAGEAGCEIGFTGGEPFMAPEFLSILEHTLARGFSVLVLTNAMRPMLRPRIKGGLMALCNQYTDRLVLRVSLDHFEAATHDGERGQGAFGEALTGLSWLSQNGFSIAIAGRTVWGETEAICRAGYARLIATHKLKIDPEDPKQLVLFPEMRADAEPPEISTGCWDILNVSPADQMCASQRMVVRRKGAATASVLACTLLPYDPAFELGTTLAEARGEVALNHPYCASFCVLGGGSCSA